MKILIKNANILDMTEENKDIYISDLLIENNKIAKIEKNINEKVDKIIDGEGKLLMPGLINLHSHLGMSLFRGYGEDHELMDWLNNYIFPKEELLTSELVYYFTMLSCIESIKSGTTCLDDMYYFQDTVIDVFEKIGIRGIIGIGGIENLQHTNITDKIKNKQLSDMISVYLDPHSAYTRNPEQLKEYINYAKINNMGIQTHLAETQSEIEIIKERYGKTPTKHLYDIGLFDVPVILAHGVYITDDDIEILKNINGGIIHNPISNAKLASGICDVTKLIKNDVLVGLGTDGASSTTSLDMFEEMKTCGYMQKTKYLKSNIIKSRDILKLATVNGSKILNKEKEIGTIEIGKKADIILINLDKPHLTPMLDIYSLLVYGINGEDVATTIINGKIIMEDRKILTIDEKEIINKCNELAKKFYI